MATIVFKNSVTGGVTPGDALNVAEQAFNIADKTGFVGDNQGANVKHVGTIAQQNSDNVTITGGDMAVATWAGGAANIGANQLTVGGTTVDHVTATQSTSSTALASQAAINQVLEDNTSQRMVNIQVFSSSGTHTWRKSSPLVTRAHVLVVGGGGGAKAYSECGGGGGFAEGVFDVSSTSTVTVTIGGGGSGNSYNNGTGNGGTTSFGSFISATGGYGAGNNANHNGGHGGVGSGGQIQSYGGMGGSHNNLDQYSPSCASGGIGGGTYFGGCMAGDRPNWSISQVSAPGTGGVSIAPNHNGQGGRSGRSGICVVYEYK